MSLLLLFPNSATPVNTGWSIISKPSSSWSATNWDYRNIWGEWATLTWGQIQASGLTWGNMAGYTFAATSTTPLTVWTVVT